jgi:hypothetical protein
LNLFKAMLLQQWFTLNAYEFERDSAVVLMSASFDIRSGSRLSIAKHR